jgi:hypothetical protein
VSELYYDRRSVGQSVLVSRPHLRPTTISLLLLTIAGLLKSGALSDERSGLSFTVYDIFAFYKPSCVIHSLT